VKRHLVLVLVLAGGYTLGYHDAQRHGRSVVVRVVEALAGQAQRVSTAVLTAATPEEATP
jgi:hypothetical protein